MQARSLGGNAAPQSIGSSRSMRFSLSSSGFGVLIGKLPAPMPVQCSQARDFLNARDIKVSLSVVQFSLLYYDYALTFSREVELFWKRPRQSWPFVLFIAHRYLTILGRVPCGVLVIVVQTIGGIVMIMRVYALYERSRCVSAILVILAVGMTVVAFWAVSAATVVDPVPTQEHLIGCPSGPLSFEQAAYLSAAWGGLLLFDVVVFGLTFWRSVYARIPGKRNISDVLLRDGSLYFAVMSAANIANIITVVVASNNLKLVTPGFTSMLMLNLRDPSIVGSAAASFPPLSHPTYGPNRTVHLCVTLAMGRWHLTSDYSFVRFSHAINALYPGVREKQASVPLPDFGHSSLHWSPPLRDGRNVPTNCEHLACQEATVVRTHHSVDVMD
ncbi:hypothetical protein EDC04DRAFT_2609930 [Pisolithus marmoratus]|nr:hypothetical protein EDC04DRAFT_2609930 [Pisolithus marmoratus]